MRKTREILRLHFESHLVPGQIGSICKVSRSTVQRCLERLKAAGLSWPLPAELDDAALERRLYPPLPVMSSEQRCLPDCAAIHKELKSRKNVTLQLLWEEYKQANPLGYAYSWYCELYREWQRQLDVVLRHEHRAGEKTFVDYAGQTVPVTDPKSGEVRQAQVFVAVLGASNYTYAEATWTQNLWDWIHSHVRAFEFLAGTSRLVVPDNLKSGVKTPCYLRAGVESHVWGSGDSLWRGDSSGATLSPQRQIQGGGRSSNRSALGAGGVAQASVLQSGGVE
jgi:transposase